VAENRGHLLSRLKIAFRKIFCRKIFKSTMDRSWSSRGFGLYNWIDLLIYLSCPQRTVCKQHYISMVDNNVNIGNVWLLIVVGMDNNNRNDRGSADTSVLDRLVNWDKAVSRRLALCSSAQSPWGHLRPFMRLLEYSCHGVPWLVGVATLLLMSHQFEMQQRLLNLFSSEYNTCCGDITYTIISHKKDYQLQD